MSERLTNRLRDAGMTLVETLVALTLVAVIASLSVLTIRGGARDADPRAEAMRLAATIEDAVDAALTGSRRLVLETRSDGYAILAPDANGPLVRRDLPGTLRLTTESRSVPVGGAFAVPFAAVLRGGGAAWTVRFDGLDATVTEGAGGDTDARS